MSEDKARALGAVLRTARERRSMSVRRAAALAGISEGRLRQIEAGVQRVGGGTHIPVRPRPATLRAVAAVVDADLAEVFELAGFPPPDAQHRHNSGEAAAEAAIRAFPGLTPAEQLALITTLRAIRAAGGGESDARQSESS